MTKLLNLAALAVLPLWGRQGQITGPPPTVRVPPVCLTLACWSLDGPRPYRVG